MWPKSKGWPYNASSPNRIWGGWNYEGGALKASWKVMTRKPFEVSMAKDELEAMVRSGRIDPASRYFIEEALECCPAA